MFYHPWGYFINSNSDVQSFHLPTPPIDCYNTRDFHSQIISPLMSPKNIIRGCPIIRAKTLSKEIHINNYWIYLTPQQIETVKLITFKRIIRGCFIIRGGILINSESMWLFLSVGEIRSPFFWSSCIKFRIPFSQNLDIF